MENDALRLAFQNHFPPGGGNLTVPDERFSTWRCLTRRRGEEICRCHFALGNTSVFVADEPVRSDEYNMDCLPHPCFPKKCIAPIFDRLGLVFPNGIQPVRKLHFAKVDDAVSAVEQQVDLRAAMSCFTPACPGVCPRLDSGNAECPTDLLHVVKTDNFKGKPLPCGSSRRSLVLQPLPTEPGRGVSHESKMEEGEVVHQLV